MIKMGEIKTVNKGVEMWGGKIEQIWLCKYLTTNHYQLLGLVRLENGKANGWCCLADSKNLKDVRMAAKKY